MDTPAQDLTGQRFESIIHSENPSATTSPEGLKDFEKCVSEGQDMHFRFKKKKGSPQSSPYDTFAFMELKATFIYLPASDTKEAFSGIYGVARDVTERVYLEDQLRQAQKMEAIGTLAGGIAHDFNNVLMGIQGYASLVKSGFNKDSDEYKRLSCIDEYIFNGAEMAKQLLGFAQKTFQETSLINLNYLLNMSAKMFGRTKKDIVIEQSLSKDLWGTVVDEGQIKQVLMNLFVNAWQAMPNGGKILLKSENVTIDRATAQENGVDLPGFYVKLMVTDSGVGMESSVIDRIFDPFFTTKTRGQGTGLGLATAYGIIKSHKGAIKATSQVGRGSTFTVFLPAKKRTAPINARRNGIENRIVSGKGSILLVDDEKGVIEVCSEMLESLGYRVTAVSSGGKALSFLENKKHPIDLVILDMVMPEMNGEETFDRIRKIEPNLKVLLSSGYSRGVHINKMMDKGFDGFIFKPFDVATLSGKISSLFDKPMAAKA